jgi:predicted GNAT family acetyltransferase
MLGDPLSVEGYFRIGGNADKSLVKNWGKKYDSERPANVSIKEFLLKKLADQQLYLWVDENPKSLATVSGENCSGLRISSVYTPPVYRSNGYATALVRDLSQKYLDGGSTYVTLNTQLGDPVERIYRKLGFKPVTEKLSVTFESD